MVKKKSSFLKKIIYSFIFIFLLIVLISGYWAYRTIYKPNVNLEDTKSEFVYIPTGSNFEDVVRILKENKILKNSSSFEWLAQKKKYTNSVKPGKYRILASMNNNALINLLRSGLQEPVEINFNGIKTTQQLISRVCRRIEADSLSLFEAMHDNLFLSKYGVNRENLQSLFIPDTYEFYWNTSVEQFFAKMYKQYQLVWNSQRKQKAKQMGFTTNELTTLASVVQSEQCCDNDEKRIIAGLYINRLRQGKELESDPTVIFAIGDFSIQRVNYEQLNYNSPFNTYIHKGLPPAPICFVQPSSIDAVLNFIPNDYMFMCAKENFSGRHNFAKSYQQHLINAKKYRDALNKRGIH